MVICKIQSCNSVSGIAYDGHSDLGTHLYIVYLKLHLSSTFGELTLSMYANSRFNDNLFQDISGPVGFVKYVQSCLSAVDKGNRL